MEDFEAELTFETAGHLYGRECCANTFYAIGALRLRQNRLADARLGFQRAVERVAAHPLAHIALAALSEVGGTVPGTPAKPPLDGLAARVGAIDAAICKAALLTLRGDDAAAAAMVHRALTEAPTGSAGWLLPVEPLLHVTAHPDAWASALERLRARAA
jgi:hypothetical protein